MALAAPFVGPALGAAAAAGTVAAIQAAAGPLLLLNRGIDEVPGVGNRDTVPALLTPGERVTPKHEVRREKAEGHHGGLAEAHVHIHATMLDRSTTQHIVKRWLNPEFRKSGYQTLRT